LRLLGLGNPFSIWLLMSISCFGSFGNKKPPVLVTQAASCWTLLACFGKESQRSLLAESPQCLQIVLRQADIVTLPVHDQSQETILLP